MTRVFGEVAAMYDDVRPGYGEEIPAAIVDYHGGVPESIVEIGAGTGKGTEALLAIGAPMTCIEPDPRMAAVLQAKFPTVRVESSTFEQWTAPAGGVPLIACALAWHWLDEATRHRRTHDSLRPGGTLAAFGHKYGYADPAHQDAVTAALHAVDSGVTDRGDTWLVDDIAGSGVFADVEATVWHRPLALSTERYLQLFQTFGPFRKRAPEQQADVLARLAAVVDGLGGSIALRLRTTLVLARRPGRASPAR
jgi:hypothetical protein